MRVKTRWAACLVTALGVAAGPYTLAKAADAKPLNIVIDGDSIAVGLGSSSATKTYASQLSDLLPSHPHVQAVGRSGLPLKETLAGFERDVASKRDPASINIVVVHAGDNDITLGGGFSDLSSLLYRYVELAHAHGWKVITTTELQRFDFPPARQQPLVDYNDAIRRNVFGADAVVDFDKDARFTTKEQRDDRRYFIADCIHPTDAGYSLLAHMTAVAVTAVAGRH